MHAKRLRIALLWLLLLVAPQAAAERVVGMTKAAYDRISSIQELFEEDKWTEALERLNAMAESRLSNYERAHVLNMSGFAWYQLDNLDRAMAAYQEALAQPDLPVSQIRGLLTTISQLALMAEDFAAAEGYAIQLVELVDEVPTDPASYVILAQARIGQDNYAGALNPLRTAISMERKHGNDPRENWLLLLSSVYYMTDDYPSMRTTLYELVSLYPNEKYLLNLAALHGQLGDTDKQLALVESLLADERLTDKQHLLSMANLFLAHGLPYKAAMLLQTETKSGRIEANQRNLEMQSQAWYMAGEKEKAIPPLEQAAALAKDGSLYMRIARLYMDSYDWNGAEAAAAKAVKHSEGDDLGDALLLQGMALANAERLDAAKLVLVKAEEHKNSARWAKQWLSYIDSEERRIASMKEWR